MIISHNSEFARGDIVNIFQKYERKMLDYMKTELNIEVEQFSLYFIEGTKYNFDFVVGKYFYNYFDNFISADNHEDYADSTEFNRDGLERDEYFNFCMSKNLSEVLLKENTAKLRAKATELVDECTNEIKVLLNGNQ